MKRYGEPLPILGDVDNWTDGDGDQMVDSDGNALVYHSATVAEAYLPMLTFPTTRRLLTFPERRIYSEQVSVVQTQEDNWLDSDGDSMVDSGGNTLVFNSAVATNVKPLVLTFPPSRRDMTAEE